MKFDIFNDTKTIVYALTVIRSWGRIIPKSLFFFSNIAKTVCRTKLFFSDIVATTILDVENSRNLNSNIQYLKKKIFVSKASSLAVFPSGARSGLVWRFKNINNAPRNVHVRFALVKWHWDLYTFCKQNKISPDRAQRILLQQPAFYITEYFAHTWVDKVYECKCTSIIIKTERNHNFGLHIYINLHTQIQIQ